ncbi:hypothetical protein [Acetobacter persici]|uniref:hypothetical protein n=1 Tax=Acetobacter persici TaxID=1076596 RepID=UPI0005BCE505|nr:hypothetical protein [Acetobacter persici]MCG0998914.1 hypothetical protein [Acetobacter persici]
MVKKSLLIASVAVVACLVQGKPANAALCPGVEGRIAAYEGEATSEVLANQTAKFGELDTLISTQLERLLSAQRVVVKQDSLSSDQNVAMAKQASEAGASAYASGWQADQIRKANDEFSSVGYNPCASESAMQQFYHGYQTAFSGDPARGIADQVRARPGSLSRPADWISDVRSGSHASASSLFSGDLNNAAQYINLVMGPPDNFTTNTGHQNEASARVLQTRKLTTDARKSAAMNVLSSIARENADNGPEKGLQAVLSQYTGDGGSRWASSLAGSDDRGILLDATRLEAANVAAEAYQVRKLMHLELAIASYTLARADKALHGRRPVGVP